jgi:hypothetical protein
VCKGDFNVVRHPRERLRASRHTQAMIDFADFIFEQGLISSNGRRADHMV